MIRALLVLGVLNATAAALGQSQNQIQWRRDPQQAVQEAQAKQMPLVVYCLGTRDDRDNSLEQAQRRALADPRVLQLLQQYIPLRLSRSRDRAVLSDFGLPPSANMMMSFVAPDGHVLGQLSANGVAQPDSLRQKLALVFGDYLKYVYQKDFQPIITDKDAKDPDLLKALEVVRKYRIAIAEKDVTELLKRERLKDTVKRQAYRALAAISSQSAVKLVVEQAWVGDELAAAVLDEFTPGGAEFMMEYLKRDNEFFPYPLYKAIATIVKLDRVKPEGFFEKAEARLIKDEVDRLDKRVTTVAKEWKERNDLGS